MAQLQPPDLPISADPPPTSTTATSSAAPPSPSQLPPAPEIPTTAAAAAADPTISNSSNLGTSLAPKRQRRPSVRLGEIGHQSFDHSLSHPRRNKTWRFHKDPSLAAKASKTRPLTNLVNGSGDSYHHEASLDNNNDDDTNYSFDFGSKKAKTKKPPTKRVRSNWASSSSASAAKFDAANGGLTIAEYENQENDEFRDLEADDGSESPIKEHSPVHSTDNHNMGLQFWERRAGGVRNTVNTVNGIHNEMNSGDDIRSSGVRDWLIGLGLGRYAPVFEIHEVDDEVLTMLTLEDLKDMGINAVGSRRKLYSAILKLKKGFS